MTGSGIYVSNVSRCTKTAKGKQRIVAPPEVPFYAFLGEGSPTKIDYTEIIEYQLILTFLLEDLVFDKQHSLLFLFPPTGQHCK